MSHHHVVVDGSNIATEGRSTPSLVQLDEAVRAFVAQHPHDKLTVVVDATFGHRIAPSEREAYEEAVLAGELVSPPAGAIGRGDAFVLQIADVADADVFSNDSFQEFHGQYTWLFDEGRLIGGKPVPEVGWVFVLRAPVRGPTSRRATRDVRTTRSRKAKTPATLATPENTPKLKVKRGGRPPAIGDVLTEQPDARAAALVTDQPAKKAGRSRQAKRSADTAAAASTATAASTPSQAPRGEGRSRRRRSGQGSLDPINETMPFLEFVGNHAVGTEVEGTIDRFSSHGAYVVADEAQCYIPLGALGDPPPRSARGVLSLGERRTFIVASIDAPRRGIDLALPGGVLPVPSPQLPNPEPVVLPDHTQSDDIAEEATPMAPTKKTPTKKAPAKKASAKRGPAKKTAAKKAPASTATAKKTTANKASAKKAPAAKKSPAKKAGVTNKAAGKIAAKKSPAKKSGVAKKTTAAKKTVSKKATTAKKTVTKKATAAKKAVKRSTR